MPDITNQTKSPMKEIPAKIKMIFSLLDNFSGISKMMKEAPTMIEIKTIRRTISSTLIPKLVLASEILENINSTTNAMKIVHWMHAAQLLFWGVNCFKCAMSKTRRQGLIISLKRWNLLIVNHY